MNLLQYDIFYKLLHFTQKVLNSGGYSVWVDETGIRAGQKWRNEIAVGIKVCFFFTCILLSKIVVCNIMCVYIIVHKELDLTLITWGIQNRLCLNFY